VIKLYGRLLLKFNFGSLTAGICPENETKQYFDTSSLFMFLDFTSMNKNLVGQQSLPQTSLFLTIVTQTHWNKAVIFF